jgi:RimJ/RimL family protein N-acetyltransferase
MSEASRTALAWLKDQGVSSDAEAFVEPDNRPSIRLALRLGFLPTREVVEGATRYILSLKP